jgi:hypothetical protein
MALFFAVHTPNESEDDPARNPSDLQGLASRHGIAGAYPRWLKAWSPDLHDDRMFTLWEADDADSIRAILVAHGFLDNLELKAFSVVEWGPEQVLESRNG